LDKPLATETLSRRVLSGFLPFWAHVSISAAG